MSDASPDPPKRRAKLPPLTTEGGPEEGEKKKVVKKKRKKPAEEPANGHTPQETDGTPRKKKVVKKKEGETTATKTTPRKRKKKGTKADGEEKEGDPSSARSAGSQGEEVTGSKTSLISKETKGTPRKKVRKKKKSTSTPSTARDDDDLADTLAAELSAIQEDVVVPDEKQDMHEVIPYSTESAVLKSQAVDKLFIETDSGFKGEKKARFAKKWAEEEAIREQEPEGHKNTTIEFAISMHKVFITMGLFIHGATAGIAVWHIVMTYILLYFDEIDFIEHYRPLALPVQCMFYILLVFCAVSASDRFDIGNPTRRFFLQSITFQTGTISVVIYVASLVCSLCIANLEDKMNLYHRYSYLWKDDQGVKLSTATSDIGLWTNLNTARCSLAILAWIVLSITASTDRFGENLKKGDDNILGDDLELGSQKV